MGDASNFDWDKFGSYARRIRVLRHTNHNTKTQNNYLSTNLIPYLSSVTPPNRLPLVPNCRRFEWTSDSSANSLDRMLFFLASSVKDIYIRTWGNIDHHSSLKITMTGLTRMGLQLSSLEICGLFSQEAMVALSGLLATQTLLTRLFLPSSSTRDTGIIQQIINMKQLRDLKITMEANSPEELSGFISLLVDGCPVMQRLSLGIPSLLTSETGEDYKIPFDAIHPLLRYPNLKKLKLDSTVGFDVNRDHVEAMGQAWRRLESFKINPLGQSNAGIPLSLLANLAGAFPPSLQKLGATIYVDDDLPPSSSRLPSLKSLQLGLSHVPSDRAKEVGRFLSQVCPPGVSIEFFDMFATPEQMDVMEEVRKGVERAHQDGAQGSETRQGTQEGLGSAE